jgi:hypothetical protein
MFYKMKLFYNLCKTYDYFNIFMNKIRNLISPIGKIQKEYYKYIGWSFISNVMVSTENTLATHNIMSMLDTCNQYENAKTINYILKDLIGQIGGLFYLSKYSKQADKNSGKFLMYSNILQQTAFINLSIAPLLSDYIMFLPITSFSSILFNVSFTCHGAINAKCIQKLSDNNKNMGELYAIITMTNTIASTIGTILGLGIVWFIPSHKLRLFLFPLFAFTRVYTYHLATRKII